MWGGRTFAVGTEEDETHARLCEAEDGSLPCGDVKLLVGEERRDERAVHAVRELALRGSVSWGVRSGRISRTLGAVVA